MTRETNSTNNFSTNIMNSIFEQQTQFKILQANLHKSKERTHGILNDPSTQQYSMILLQEQFWSTYTNSSPSHHGWICYEPTNKNKSPRAAIYVNNEYFTPSQIYQIPIGLTDVVAIQIQANKESPALTIINTYNPCDDSLILPLEQELKKIQVSNEDMIILAGDFNCHHPLWNPPAYLRHDEAGDQLTQLAAQLGLNLLIPPGTITYPTANTAIDLVWGNSKVQDRLLKCQIAKDSDQGADHLPVETLIQMDTSISHGRQQKIKLDISRTNWDKFNQELQGKLPATTSMPQSCKEIDENTTALIHYLQEALKATTPTKQPMPRNKRWWNSNLTKLAKEHRRLRNRKRRRKTPLDIQLWKAKSDEYTSEIAKAKEKCWQKFVQEANGKSIWDIKKYLDGSQSQTNIPMLEDKTSYGEMTEILQRNFFPEPPEADLTDIQQRTNYPPAVPMDFNITIEQIRRAVNKPAPNKAPGPDEITNKVLQKALPLIEKWLQQICQATINLGYYPKVLKASTTVVLRKPGKPDYTKVKAYRPIALESTIGKVFESVMAEILSYLTETHDLLPSHHFGGRPGRSTEDALMIMIENIYKAWKNEQVYSAVFLDVAGAFNYVHHSRLYDNLRKRGIPKGLAQWLLSFLQDRSTKLQFNGASSDEIQVPAGVPQGSPLSPLLFMFYNADLLDYQVSSSDMALGFIDDVVYGTAGTSDIANSRHLKQMLLKAEVWRKQHGAQFEESKYVLIHFTRNRFKSTKAPITINKTKISPSDEAKYLGVVLDKQLRFKAHLQYALKKGTKIALGLNSIGKSTWGAPYKYIRQLFQSVVATRLDYGAVIWHRPKSDGSTAASLQSKKLTTVQRISMKATLGCYRTTSTAAMEVESAIMPVHLRLQVKTQAAVVRFQSLSRKHPIQRWLARARKKVLSGTKIRHLSNLENMLAEFPLTSETVQTKEPFQQAPWTCNQSQDSDKNHNLPSKEDQKKQIKEAAKKAWEDQWNKLANKSHLYRIIGKEINNGYALYAQLKHRSQAAQLIQLRTGHCGLNNYLARFNKIDSPKCTKCGYEQETVEHFLLECPAHWEARRDLRRKVGVGRMTLGKLLGDEKMVEWTMEYIWKTKRFVEDLE
jgi:Reverse transcriptase (RNA-dependent DNA polymerase)/Endonuclease-reverse transcriptase